MEAQSAFVVYKNLNKNTIQNQQPKRKLENQQQHVAKKKLKDVSGGQVSLNKFTNGSSVVQNGKTQKKKRKKSLKVNGQDKNVKISKDNLSISKPKKQSLNPEKSSQKAIMQNGNLQIKKSNKKHKEIKANTPESDDEEPPLLVPYDPTEEIIEATEIHLKKPQKTRKNKNEKKPKTSTSGKENDEVSKMSKDLNPVTYGSGVFKWLIYPIGPQEFFEKYWEKNVLHIERKKNGYYEDILSTEKLDSIFRENNLHYTRNVDVVTYDNGVKEVHNQEGRAIPSVLWDFYSNGCSIRVLNPQTYDQNVHSIISSLQEYFGTMVGTNVYLTPPGSQGFAPHYDDIEAFIVQLEGRKHWKLYRPKGADVLARNSSQNFNAAELDAPFMEVCLNAGDLLYFPRGTIHEGRTDKDAHSLHITASVYQHTAYADLLEHILPQALLKAANEDVEFRKGLPINYLKHVGHVNRNRTSSKRTAIIKNTKKLLQKMIDHIDVDLAADQLGKKFMYDAMPPLYSAEEAMCSSKYDGDYMKNGKVYNRVELDSETKVRLLRYHCLRLVVDSTPNSPPKLYYCTDNAKFYHGEEEQWLEIEPDMVPGVQMLQNKFPEFVAVEELPKGSDKLIADLWERGLIVTSEALPSISSDVEDEHSQDEDSDSLDDKESNSEDDNNDPIDKIDAEEVYELNSDSSDEY